MALLFLSPDDPADLWRAELQARIPGLDVRIWPELGDPAEIDLALVAAAAGELARYPNLRAILSLAAGIDGLIADPDLPDVPIARMVDPSLTRTMAEYVLLAVLRHHREFDRFERAQRAHEWAYAFPPQAADRRVGLMGLGELGSAAARALVAHGFQVLGWSRTPKALDGVVSFPAAASCMPSCTAPTSWSACLPLTADTVDILDAATFAELPHGACVINVARGQHLVEDDLIDALDSDISAAPPWMCSARSRCRAAARCGITRRCWSRRMSPATRCRRPPPPTWPRTSAGLSRQPLLHQVDRARVLTRRPRPTGIGCDARAVEHGGLSN